ncbi:MAG: hypothetical protein LBT54_03800 [Bifidobacteriaceae bacterium]|jgi:hypothetical protein|nr:hypothetical protein [Bifidobacteriaceae bacterium]
MADAPAASGGVAFGRLARALGLLALGVAVASGIVGYALAGRSGLWGALIGAGLTGAFCGSTAVVMAATAKRPMAATSAGVVIAWVGKMVLLVGAMLALDGRDFFDRTVLGVTVVVGVVGSLALDARVVLKARIAPGD